MCVIADLCINESVLHLESSTIVKQCSNTFVAVFQQSTHREKKHVNLVCLYAQIKFANGLLCVGTGSICIPSGGANPPPPYAANPPRPPPPPPPPPP